MQLKNSQSQWQLMDCTFLPSFSESRTIGVTVVAREIKADEQKSFAFQDRLTGLFTREYMEEEIKRLNTTRQLPLSVFNDRYE